MLALYTYANQGYVNLYVSYVAYILKLYISYVSVLFNYNAVVSVWLGLATKNIDG